MKNIENIWEKFNYVLTKIYALHSINHYTSHIQSGTRNVIPLIVHVTHFYYYKSI